MIVFFKKVDYPFLMTISQINIPKFFLRNFQSMLYFSLLPGSHYEKFLQLFCIAISPWWRANIFRYSSAKRKWKLYIFIYKTFRNSFFKSYTTIGILSHALVKWSHYKWSDCKLTSLFLIFKSLARNTIITVSSICTGSIALGHCTDLASSVGTELSSNISQSRSKK